jgi:hypothetical protein
LCPTRRLRVYCGTVIDSDTSLRRLKGATIFGVTTTPYGEIALGAPMDGK